MILARTSSPAETSAIAAAVAALCGPGDVVVLAGEMGAGKTAFAQGVARGLGVTEPVTSPTFNLLHRYDGSLPVYHADVYRLETIGELADLGFGDLDDGILLVEWGDVVAALLGDHLAVHLAHPGAEEPENVRHLQIGAAGRAWLGRMDRLAAAVAAALGQGDGQ